MKLEGPVSTADDWLDFDRQATGANAGVYIIFKDMDKPCCELDCGCRVASIMAFASEEDGLKLPLSSVVLVWKEVTSTFGRVWSYKPLGASQLVVRRARANVTNVV